jgi:hypothetical protein
MQKQILILLEAKAIWSGSKLDPLYVAMMIENNCFNGSKYYLLWKKNVCYFEAMLAEITSKHYFLCKLLESNVDTNKILVNLFKLKMNL